MKYSYLVLVGILILGAVLLPGCTAGQGAKNGDTVKVNYVGRLADGTVFDSSVGRQPFEFTLGAQQMIPGFDKAVRGMKVGEKKTVTIKAKDAYGERNNNLVEQATRQEFPPGFEPKVGSQLQGTHADGKPRIYTIAEVTDTIITLDANPPLAGKDLTFEIELVEID